MSLNWTTFTTSLANMLVVPVNDTGFVTALSNIVDDAENRIYRDLDLLQTIVRNSSLALSAGNRNFTLPTASSPFSGPFVVTEDINVITPSGQSNP